jgi:predicted AlkP superfamily pyrophosphatase or phosphodiesterase
MRSLVALLLFAAAFFVESAPARDLAHYDKGGIFDFPLYPSSDAQHKKYDRDNARLREFVWSHWTQRRRGYVRVIHHGVEGQSFVGDHYIEPDDQGRWTMSWDGQEPMRIYRIEQIQPRADFPASRWRFEWMGYAGRFWKDGKRLAHPISGDGSKYMLQLRDKKGVIVALF